MAGSMGKVIIKNDILRVPCSQTNPLVNTQQPGRQLMGCILPNWGYSTLQRGREWGCKTVKMTISPATLTSWLKNGVPRRPALLSWYG